MNNIDYGKSLGGFLVKYSGGLSDYPDEIPDLYLYIFPDYIIIKDSPKRKTDSGFYKRIPNTQIAFMDLPQGKLIYNELLINYYENDELRGINLYLQTTLTHSGVNSYNRIMKLLKSSGISDKFIKPKKPAADELSNALKENRRNTLPSFSVSYLGGLYEYSEKVNDLTLYFSDDHIELKSGKSAGVSFYKAINYPQITDFQIKTEQVINPSVNDSSAIAYSRFFNFSTLLHIDFIDSVKGKDKALTLRLSVGIGEHARETGNNIIDLIKVNGYTDKFRKSGNSGGDDIFMQIEKLAKLHKENIITDDEFESKKSELLDNIK